VFISIHANGGLPGQRGAEIWVHPHANPSSRQLAARLQRALAHVTPGGASLQTGELAVLDPGRLGARTEACLLELDYLTNPDGESGLADPATVDRIARVLATALERRPDRRPCAGRYGVLDWAGALQEAKALQAPGPAVGPAPAAALAAQVDGIDIFENNTDLPPWIHILNGGFRFVIHKTNEFQPDTRFLTRWPELQDGGFIRGTFDLVRHRAGTPEQQANAAAGLIKRLLPGDLGPTLDMEDRDPAHTSARDPGFWVGFAHRYLDRIESALGRRPMIFTSRSFWQEFVGNSDEFVEYPLWVIDVNHARDADVPNIAGQRIWPAWTFWQWHTEESTTPMPAPFTAADSGVDLDRFNGTIYQLRGLADFGHTAPHVAANTRFIAHTTENGRIHLLTDLGFWLDWDLLNDIPGPPIAAGDPAAIGIGDEQIVVFRAMDNHVYALTRIVGDPAGWSWRDITSATGAASALDDPCVTVMYGNEIHVAYWDANDNQAHLTRVGGDWHVEDMSTGAPRASGSATLYLHENAYHLVSRAGSDGHLHDLHHVGGANPPADDDLTATAVDGDGSPPPAATYRPTVYLPTGGAPRIVFRAVRGAIWEIERDTLRATNLGQGSGGAPSASGNPSAIFAQGTAHILYRAVDGAINELTDDGAGNWHWRDIGCGRASADPTAFLDGDLAAVTFQSADGNLHLARLSGGTWSCEDVIPSQAPPG